MANNDRVLDLYLRRIHSVEAQDACRDRIHWLCRQATGRSVLDIGCSQGICGMILAREGRRVVAIDIEPQQIEAAREAIREEPQEVRQRVSFQVADAFSAEFEPASFDAVILGEVLEHLVNPAQLLERVAGWLVPGGRVVVSVPLGYEPFHDHKQTFFLLRLLELLGERFTVTDVAALHARYLCAVAELPPPKQAPAPPTLEQLRGWLRECERASEAAERRLHDERARLQAERARLSERSDTLAKSVASQKSALAAAEKKLAAAEAELARRNEAHQTAIKELEARLTARAGELEQQARQSAQQLAEAVARAGRLDQARRDAEDSIRALREQLEQATRACAAQREKVQQLERDLAAERARTRSLATESETRRLEQERVEQLLELERSARRKVERNAAALKEQLALAQATLRLKQEEVRYRLGDAMVRAARPSRDTLLLPVRMASLFVEGLARSRARRREARQQRRDSTPAPSADRPAGGGATAPPSQRGAAASAAPARPSAAAPTFEPVSLLPPYTPAPAAELVRPGLRVAAIVDEFSWRAWQYEADLFTFEPHAWERALSERPPNLLLVESTWSGVRDSWRFQVRDYGQRPDAVRSYVLAAMVDWCRQRDIPTVFYNKEDPPNFDVFLEAARLFDYVFTSDANCVGEYQKLLGHARVMALPFAAQPRIHNPLHGGDGRPGRVCFAGTWYTHRHFRRQEEAEWILKPALPFGLDIYDRMAERENPDFGWPAAYRPAIRGALPYARMLSAYRGYRVFLNINIVADSPTMFSRRVFELLACETPVISAYSVGIDRLLGPELVPMSRDADTTRRLLEGLLSDEEARRRLAVAARRRVFAEHTASHRLNAILRAVGLSDPAPLSCPIDFVAPIEERSHVAAAWANFRRQAHADKRLVLCALRGDLVADAADAARSSGEHATVIVAEADTWGALLAKVAQRCRPGRVALMNPRDYYGEHYLTDCAHAHAYIGGAPIGKATYYQTGRDDGPRLVRGSAEHGIGGAVHPWTLCLRSEDLQALARELPAGAGLSDWSAELGRRCAARAYAGDRYNYVAADGAGAPAVPEAASNGAERAGRLQPALA